MIDINEDVFGWVLCTLNLVALAVPVSLASFFFLLSIIIYINIVRINLLGLFEHVFFAVWRQNIILNGGGKNSNWWKSSGVRKGERDFRPQNYDFVLSLFISSHGWVWNCALVYPFTQGHNAPPNFSHVFLLCFFFFFEKEICYGRTDLHSPMWVAFMMGPCDIKIWFHE